MARPPDSRPQEYELDVTELIARAGKRARSELKTPVDVVETDEFPALGEIRSQSRTWLRLDDVVAVVADLKGSTKLSFRRHAGTSARTYEAITGCCIEIVEEFEPDFVDIQGDGLFALFYGDLAYEYAFCAALTLKTFSEREFLPAIEKTMPEGYPTDTGLKTGIAASTLLVRKVGTRTTNEPVWAGKAVNYAMKCAQAADAHELIVTGPVFEVLTRNDYVNYSCRCVSTVARIFGAAPHRIWEPIQVRALAQAGQHCRVLRRPWCEVCGPDFCKAILSGETDREDAPGWIYR